MATAAGALCIYRVGAMHGHHSQLGNEMRVRCPKSEPFPRACTVLKQNADTAVTDKLSFLLCSGVYCSYLLAEAERNLKPTGWGSPLVVDEHYSTQSNPPSGLSIHEKSGHSVSAQG